MNDETQELREANGWLASIEGKLDRVVDLLTPKDKAPAHAPTGTAAGDPSPPPAAADAPQVGDVWEDTRGLRVTITNEDEYAPFDGVDEHGRRWAVLPGPWRRVSPAPAPLTEREVTAEAQTQDGVEPASDEQVALMEHHACDETWVSTTIMRRDLAALIARVRAAEARAEQAEAHVALMRPVVAAVSHWNELLRAPHYLSQPARGVHDSYRAYREATRGE